MENNDERIKKIMEQVERKLSEGREFRMTHKIEARSAEDDGKMIVRGYATTFNDEYLLFDFGDYRVFESVDPHAFDECDMTDVIMQYDHAGRVFARNRNKTLQLGVDDHGLGIEAELSGTELGRQVYEEIDGGYTDRMSMCFSVGKDERTIEEDYENGVITVHRKITAISKLYDVSAVSYPANPATEISARNFCEGVIAEIKQERLRAQERANRIRRLELRIKAAQED